MQDEHNTPTVGVSNDSEASDRLSESFGKEGDVASERDPSLSERNELLRKENDPRFGKTPFASERNTPSFPKASEAFRSNLPSASETIDEILSRPERRPAHTLTAREVEKLFEQAGRPVTERSILNWCKPNSEGICRLNCGYERGERRWYITPDSVERVIEEERKKDQSVPKESLEFSEASDRLSESFGKEPPFASERDPSLSERNAPLRKENDDSFGKTPFASERETTFFRKDSERAETHHASDVESAAGRREAERMEEEAALKKELDNLQKLVTELQREAAAGEWKDEVITSLRERFIEMKDRVIEDRKDYNERMTFFQTQIEKLQTKNDRYVEELVGINRHVGQLEAEVRTLRMLPAGKPETRNGDGDNMPRPEEPFQDAFETTHASEVIHHQPPNEPPYHV